MSAIEKRTLTVKSETVVKNQPDPNRATKAFEEGVLVMVSIGKKSWKTSLTPQDFGLEKFPDNFEPGRRRLLPQAALEKIDFIEGQARRAVDKFSFNYGNLNSRVKFRWIHLSKFGLVNMTLNELQTNFFVAVDELIANYEAHKAKMKAEFPEQWQFLEKSYPPVEVIRKDYYFEIQVLNVVFPNQITAVKDFELKQADLAILDRERAEKMTQAQLAEYQRKCQEEMNRTIRQAQEQAIKQSEEFVDNAVKQLRGHVVKVFNDITEKIKGGKTLIKTNINTLRATLQEVRQLDFIGSDAAFHQQLERVEKLLDSGREFKDDASAVAELDGLLKATVTHINTTESEAVAAAHKTYFGRRLNI